MVKNNWWRRLLNLGQAPSRPRAAGRRTGLRLRLEELEARWVPATVQFNAASEFVNQTAGTFSIPVTETGVTPTVSTFASGFHQIQEGLAFDAAGNLYVADVITGTVSKVTPAGVVSTFASGFSFPEGLAFDAAGNLYVANQNANTVSKVTPAGVISTFASGFSLPDGLAFDAAGNLYVTNAGNDTVSKVTPAGVRQHLRLRIQLPRLAWPSTPPATSTSPTTMSPIRRSTVSQGDARGGGQHSSPPDSTPPMAWPSTPPATSTSPTGNAR